MDADTAAGARRLGVAAAVLLVILQALYAVALAAGLAALEAPDRPIPDPFFTAMEALILLIAPVLVALFAALHAWAPGGRKAPAAAALAFATLAAGLTSAVHFAVLTLGRRPEFADQPQLLSFTWPSAAYAADILAWDVFFALAALFAAAAIPGRGLAAILRGLLIASGLLSLAGLAGVAVGDMAIRNIGILGYAVVFPFAAATLALLLRSDRPRP